MRTAPLLIALFLLAGAAALAYLPVASTSTTAANAGPGSYPLGPLFQWPAKIRTAPFQPAKSTGSDEVPRVTSVDAKSQCLNECPAITPASSKLLFV